jgi:YesN/AraC family two-component response regulator
MTYCEEIGVRKTSQTKGRSMQIMEYIAQNYHNPDMGLNHLADVFNITESYISLCIKEYTGRNYSEHIESFRMNKAMQLLIETKKNISEVARLTGYANINTFYKAFKKIHHFPPNHFRHSNMQ